MALKGVSMRRGFLLVLIGIILVSASLLSPQMRGIVRTIVRPEPPLQITPQEVALPQPTLVPKVAPTSAPTARPTRPPATATQTLKATAPAPTAVPTVPPSPTSAPSPTAGPIEVNGRLYDAYIPAASKLQQFYSYSCEFDATWVVLETYGVSTSIDELINIVGVDSSIEPTIRQTSDGFLIYGGDITNYFSGSIDENFLARATGGAFRKAFVHYDLAVTVVDSRAAVEEALRAGQLVWMKTTVDFKPWRSATWVMPNGDTRPVVLGNDHAVVAMGFSERGVVIRDVLGPTSSNWQRPYEYEVSWEAFLAAWGAQGFDGLAVARPAG